MILCDYLIKDAIERGEIIVDPPPQDGQYGTTSLNLRIGDDPRRWSKVLSTQGLRAEVDLDTVRLNLLLPLTEAVPIDGGIAMEPGDFIIVRTLETIKLPPQSKLAARVEGRSTCARLGMSVHITAPTIHAGFTGKITLEMLNHGPLRIRMTPNVTEVCQLIFERVEDQPRGVMTTAYIDQTTPLGTPGKKSN